jgi:hypothetical protein
VRDDAAWPQRTEFPGRGILEHVPAGVSASADGYALYTEARIVLITSTSAFARARSASDRCGDVEAIREIAGVLAHEEWHVRHGPDEQGAYDAQLIALLYVDAGQNSPLFHKVMRAKRAVSDRAKPPAEDHALARGATRNRVDQSSLTGTPVRRPDGP